MMVAMISLFLSGCDTSDNGKESVGLKITAVSPESGKTVSLANEVVGELVTAYTPGRTSALSDGSDQYFGRDVRLRWAAVRNPAPYTIRLSTSENMSDATLFETEKSELILSDLYVATEYFWTITAEVDGKMETSKPYRFTTAATPRSIHLEGISNTRDIGGYTVEGDKRVRQGMVYRGAAPDGITDAGKQVAAEIYNIKTELDLRELPLRESPFGKEVRYLTVSGLYYVQHTMGIDNVAKQKNLAEEIRVFAEPENYPIYFHCALGRDRTGTLALLLNALLGVSEQDLTLDYELSFLSVAGNSDKAGTGVMLADQFQPTLNYLKGYADGTLQENCEKFLLDIGITEEEIASIKATLLE